MRSPLALFGKLPAHGDFVRRGPADVVRRLDDWLTGEVERIARGKDEAVDAVPGASPWAFTLPDGTAGALVGSHDRVGRVFPLVCRRQGGRGVAEVSAALLRRALDEMLDATALATSLAEVDGDDGDDPAPAPGARWWQPLAARPRVLVVGGLPVGAEFDRLIEEGA